MQKINLKKKLSLFDEKWTPKIVAELNGQHVKIAKVEGDFIWHCHENEDELFYVVSGELILEFRDKTEILGVGEMIVVPRGVEHRPRTAEGKEAHIMMFEPKSTLNTGNQTSEKTVQQPDKI